MGEGKWGTADEWVWGFLWGDAKVLELDSDDGCTTS